MGQRTSIILKVTDKENNTKVTVYHDQWGIGRKPLLNVMSLFHAYYNKMFGKSVTETVRLFPEQSGIIKEYEIMYDKDGNATSAHFEEDIDVFADINALESPQKIGEYIGNKCDNNNGALVIFVDENNDFECDIRIGFLMGGEDEYRIEKWEENGKVKKEVLNKGSKKLGKAFERWLSVDEWCGMDINKSYADKKFTKLFKGFMDYFDIKDMGAKPKEKKD